MKLIVRVVSVALLATLFSGLSMAQEKLTFRAPDESAFTNYVTAVLEEAYRELGIQLNYIDLPRVRGEQLAAEGTIAGELGRTTALENKRHELRRVPFPLFRFDILAVTDRRRCGYCRPGNYDSLAYVNGMDSITTVVQQLSKPPSVVTPTDLEQVVKLVEAGRVDAAFMADFQYQGSVLSKNPNFITHRLSIEQGFHYLNEEHARLIPQLTYQLQKLKESGRIEELQKAYGVHTMPPAQPLDPSKPVVVLGPVQKGLTNADGTGKLWAFAKRVFPEVAELHPVVTSWQRAKQMIQEARADALLGVRASQRIPNTILSKYHVGYDDSLYLFSLEEQNEGPICLSGPRFIEDLVDTQRPFYRADSSLDCFALLDMGRVNAVVDYRSNLPDWTEKPYKQQLIAEPSPLFVAFPATPRGRSLKRAFDHYVFDNVNEPPQN
jgi:ABC-type amino acid transport substrate-binding protein